MGSNRSLPSDNSDREIRRVFNLVFDQLSDLSARGSGSSETSFSSLPQSAQITNLEGGSVTILTHGQLQGRNVTGSHKATAVSYIPTSETSYDKLESTNVQEIIEETEAIISLHEPGTIVIPDYLDNLNGTVTISGGEFAFYSDSTYTTLIRKYINYTDYTFALADNDTSYIYAKYDVTGVIIAVTTDRDDIEVDHLATSVPIFTCHRKGTFIKCLCWGTSGVSGFGKLLNKDIDTNGFSRSNTGGLIISHVSSLTFTISAGEVWNGNNSNTVGPLDSTTDNCLLYEYNGATWSSSAITASNNTQYQGATGFETLTANRYAVNWIYVSVADNDNTIYVLLGGGDYKLIEAQASDEPAPPEEVHALGILIGRIIVRKGETTPTQIDSAFEHSFQMTPATNHPDIAERDAADSHPASAITNTPYGDITAVDTQTATNQLTDKVEAIEQVGIDTHRANGFVDRSQSTLSIVGRTVSIDPTATEFEYYMDNVLHTSTGDSVEYADTVGTHYIYYDYTTKALTASMTFPHPATTGNVIVAISYWDGSAGTVNEERHGAGRPLYIHAMLHNTVGTQYDYGLTVTCPTTGDPDILQIEEGRIWDEDIPLFTAQQKLVRHWYETAPGVWTWKDGVDNGGYDYPYMQSSGTPQYLDSDTYALTNLSASRRMCLWVYASSDIHRPIYVVNKAIPDGYNTDALAKAEAEPVVSSISPELKLLYRFIYRGSGALILTEDYRSVSSLPGGAPTVTYHDSTANISGGLPGEYNHLSDAEYLDVQNQHDRIKALHWMLGGL